MIGCTFFKRGHVRVILTELITCEFDHLPLDTIDFNRFDHTIFLHIPFSSFLFPRTNTWIGMSLLFMIYIYRSSLSGSAYIKSCTPGRKDYLVGWWLSAYLLFVRDRCSSRYFTFFTLNFDRNRNFKYLIHCCKYYTISDFFERIYVHANISSFFLPSFRA